MAPEVGAGEEWTRLGAGCADRGPARRSQGDTVGAGVTEELWTGPRCRVARMLGRRPAPEAPGETLRHLPSFLREGRLPGLVVLHQNRFFSETRFRVCVCVRVCTSHSLTKYFLSTYLLQMLFYASVPHGASRPVAISESALAVAAEEGTEQEQEVACQVGWASRVAWGRQTP